MKLVDLTCPSCGGKMQVNSELETVTCNFCGKQMIVDKEIVEQRITGGFDFGYEQEQGRLKAIADKEERKRQQTQKEINEIKKYYKHRIDPMVIITIIIVIGMLAFCYYGLNYGL